MDGDMRGGTDGTTDEMDRLRAEVARLERESRDFRQRAVHREWVEKTADRLRAMNRELRRQRQQLALRVSGLTGEDWETVLERVGVEPQTPRDPRPSEVVPAENLDLDVERAPESFVDRDELLAQLAEARAWARGYEHKMFVGVDTDAPPAWLTAPLELKDE